MTPLIRTPAGIIHDLLPENALTVALAGIEKLLLDDGSGRPKAERALEQLLAVMKDHSGIPENLSKLLQNLATEPEKAIRTFLLEKFPFWQAAVNRVVALQGDHPWLINSDGMGGFQLVTLKNITGQTPVSLDFQLGDETKAETGHFRLMVSGELKSQLQIQVPEVAKAEKAYEIEVPTPDANRVVVYSLFGDIGIEGEVAAQTSGGKAGMGAGVQGDARLSCVFQHPADTTTIRVLENGFKCFAKPLDLGDLYSNLAEVGQAGFRQLRIEGSRSGWLDVTFDVARAVSTPTLVKTPDKTATLSLNQKLGASVQVKYRASASRTMVVSKQSGGLELKSKHASLQNQKFGLNVGAGIELVGIGDVARQWAAYLLPDSKDLEDLLTEYSAPGELLKGKITEVLKDEDDWAQTLGELLLGETGSDSAAAALTEKLNSAVSDQLNGLVDIFDFAEDKSTELAQSLVANVAADNPLLAIFRKEITAKVAGDLEEPLKEFWEKFRARVDETSAGLAKRVEEKTKQEVAKQLQPLAKFGLDVADALDRLDEGGQVIIGPVIQLLKKYGEQRKKLLEAVSESVKVKLGISLAISRNIEERLGGAETWLLATPPSEGFGDQAQADFRKWLVGRLPAKADFGGAGRLRDGSFSYGITDKQTTNVTLDLGPLTFGWEGVIGSNADFKVALDGTILVGKAGFEGREKSLKLAGRSAESRFAGMMPAVSSTGEVSGEPFLISHTYRNTDCEQEELSAYLGSIQKLAPGGLFDLLPANSSSRILAEFIARKTEGVKAELAFVIHASTLKSLIDDGLDEDKLAALLWKAYEAKYSDLMKRFYDSFFDKPGEEGRLVRWLVQESPKHNQQRWRNLKWVTDRERGLRLAIDEVFKLIHAFRGAMDFFRQVELYEEWRSGLKVPDAIVGDKAKLEKWVETATREAYEFAHQAAAELRWVVDSAGQAAASDEVPPDTLALLAYFDAVLEDDKVIARLNLETEPSEGGGAWKPLEFSG